MSILITGATGHIGGTLVRLLDTAGHKTRAYVRDPARAKLPAATELRQGDLDDREALARALDGAEAAFLMQGNHDVAQTETMIAAVRAAGVPRVVVLSSIGAVVEPQPLMGTWFAAKEKLWSAAGPAVTFLRPSSFMTNTLWWLPALREHGHVVDATGPGRMSPVDPDDIAAVAAAVLTGDGHAGQGYTLTGQELLTTREQAAILAAALGRPVAVADATPAYLAGLPEPLRDLNAHLRDDRVAFLTDAVARLTGRAPGTFEAWCRRNTSAFEGIAV
ncbi:NmrA family NAD(P)-binding protein [Hamadaea tsunoensis]|uniref:NmrA family NAD(P)-binding protein n=1 Tax=Hamadaea tsunoensis TaxID=53368 RepID=UPI0004236401|nr:NmrA family NAD(P)-binding protein [Hamadaea tsunoensis]